MNKNQKRKRRPFTPDEDKRLRELVDRYGEQNWSVISCQMTNRTVRQCRDRWTNSLCGNVVKGEWTADEDALLLQLFKEQGSRWKSMEKFFPGRAQYDIRNHCKSIVNQKLCAINFFNQKKLISSSMKNRSKASLQMPSKQQLSPMHPPIPTPTNVFQDHVINEQPPASCNSVLINSSTGNINQLNNDSLEINKAPAENTIKSKPFINLKNIDPILVPFISEPMLFAISTS